MAKGGSNFVSVRTSQVATHQVPTSRRSFGAFLLLFFCVFCSRSPCLPPVRRSGGPAGTFIKPNTVDLFVHVEWSDEAGLSLLCQSRPWAQCAPTSTPTDGAVHSTTGRAELCIVPCAPFTGIVGCPKRKCRHQEQCLLPFVQHLTTNESLILEVGAHKPQVSKLSRGQQQGFFWFHTMRAACPPTAIWKRHLRTFWTRETSFALSQPIPMANDTSSLTIF